MASDERAASVLEQVRKLTNEVHPHAARVTVTLDSPFDDLGIGSLELAELLRRLQDAFGVVLPSDLLASAETPRDLLRAVTQIRARSAEDIGVALPPAVGAGQRGAAGRVDVDRSLRLACWRDPGSDARAHSR